MVIVWSRPARVVQNLVNKVEVLLELPRIGRVVPEISEENVREISQYSYRILYELIGDTIYIHGVIHQRRLFKPEDLQRE